MRRAEFRNWEAASAFEILGTNAGAAVPDLIRIFEAKITPYSRSAAAQALGGIGPEAGAAVPCLLSNAVYRSDSICSFAPEALGEIGAAPEKAVPVLVKLLQDPNRVVRASANHGLRAFGTPTLIKLLTNPDVSVRSAATIALKLVDPKAAAEA
jgi:HEAT repeat protein